MGWLAFCMQQQHHFSRSWSCSGWLFVAIYRQRRHCCHCRWFLLLPLLPSRRVASSPLSFLPRHYMTIEEANRKIHGAPGAGGGLHQMPNCNFKIQTKSFCRCVCLSDLHGKFWCVVAIWRRDVTVNGIFIPFFFVFCGAYSFVWLTGNQMNILCCD